MCVKCKVNEKPENSVAFQVISKGGNEVKMQRAENPENSVAFQVIGKGGNEVNYGSLTGERAISECIPQTMC